MEVWDDVLKGVLWVIGNGERTRFLLDAWLPSKVILRGVAIDVIPEEMLQDLLCVYTDDVGNWRLDLVQHLLPTEIIAQIQGCMAIKAPHREDVPT